MSHFDIKSAKRPDPDQVLVDIAEYACSYAIDSEVAYETARYCLMDTLACGFQALAYPACKRLLGPIVPGATMAGGARVPGTSYELDPVRAAFNIGAMIRWLDFNDTWLAAEWGHPSDNLGGILAVADYLSRKAAAEGGQPLTVRDVLTAMIKAHEIQGVTALENSYNRVGLDHVILVRVASTGSTIVHVHAQSHRRRHRPRRRPVRRHRRRAGRHDHRQRFRRRRAGRRHQLRHLRLARARQCGGHGWRQHRELQRQRADGDDLAAFERCGYAHHRDIRQDKGETWLSKRHSRGKRWKSRLWCT